MKKSVVKTVLSLALALCLVLPFNVLSFAASARGLAAAANYEQVDLEDEIGLIDGAEADAAVADEEVADEDAADEVDEDAADEGVADADEELIDVELFAQTAADLYALLDSEDGAGAPYDEADGEGRCTSFYMGKGVTENGSYIWGRSEDLGARYAKLLVVKPAMDYAPGTVYYSGNNSFTWVYPEHTLRYIMCKDSNASNGPYNTDEVYAEVGVNEMNVAISATVTISGVKTQINSRDAMQTRTGMEESDVASIVLMQATSARHACEILAEVYDTKGSASRDGIMISDPNEVWYFQILTGHQYVAVKCPDDMIGYSPNITGNVGGKDNYVDVSDTDNVIASAELISLPQAAGVLVADPENPNRIKIADTYASGMTNHQSGRMRVGYGYLYGYTSNEEIGANLPASQYMNYFVEPRADKKYSLLDAMGLLACRGQGTDWEVANPTGNGSSIGNSGTLEAHVFEVRPNMPAQLATIEWITMGPAEFSVYLPFIGGLVTDTIEKYYSPDTARYIADDPDGNNVYYAFRELYAQCAATNEAERQRLGNGVREFWGAYQRSLIKQQAYVDAYLTKILKTEGVARAQAVATEISMRVSEEAYGYAKQILAELVAFKAAGTAGEFKPSLLGTAAETATYAQVTLGWKNVEPGNGQVNVNFAIASANGKGYTLYLSDAKDGKYALYSNVNYNASGAHIKGLTNGKVYYVIIKYADDSGVVLATDPIEIKPSK